MSAVDGTIYLTEAEYLEGERHSEVRHELVGWQAWAMAGASERLEAGGDQRRRERARTAFAGVLAAARSGLRGSAGDSY